MPWEKSKVIDPKEAFVKRRLGGTESFKASCLACGISRQSGYKWWGRFCAKGVRGLRPRRRGRRGYQAVLWKKRFQQLRRQYRHWGAHLLRMLLVRDRPRARVPATRTIERWLNLHRRTRRRAPQLPPLVRTAPTAPNTVLTVDFKGWFRARDGTRIELLTVRDLYSGQLLLVRDMPRKDYASVRRALTDVFRKYGLPQAIWTDNGPPFGGEGALGLTRLSVWWLCLGIRVEFGRPATPGDNGAHENMHGVLQRELANSPAANRSAQLQQVRRWVKIFNTVRPQGTHNGAAPAMLYRRSARRWPKRLPAWPVSSKRPVRVVSNGGWISYEGKKRLIGRPFAGQPVGLHRINERYCEVYLGVHLLGHLHFVERLMRATPRQTPVQGREGAAPPPLQPSPNITVKKRTLKV